MKKIICAMLVWFSLVMVCNAYFSGGDVGTRGGQFLKIGQGSRAAGMGEAQVSGLGADTNIMFYNPAGLGKLRKREALFGHTIWLEGISIGNVVLGLPLKKGMLGIGVIYLNIGEIQKYDNIGNKTNSSMKPWDASVNIAYGLKVKNVSYGINVKYIQSVLDDTAAQTVAMDLGIAAVLKRKLYTGFSVQNIGTGLKHIHETSGLPLIVRAGVGYGGGIKRIECDIVLPMDNEPYLSFGGEYIFRAGKGMNVISRIGYKTNTKGIDGLFGVSGGVGLILNGYSIDYAWVPFGELSDTHRVSVSVKF